MISSVCMDTYSAQPLYGCLPLIAAIIYHPCILPYQWLKHTSTNVDRASSFVYMYTNFHKWINIDDLTRHVCIQKQAATKAAPVASNPANIPVRQMFSSSLHFQYLYFIRYDVLYVGGVYVCIMVSSTTCIHFAVFICTCVYVYLFSMRYLVCK